MPQFSETKQRRTLEPSYIVGVLGNPWSVQHGNVEVDYNPAAPSGYIPMVNAAVVAEPTVAKTRNKVHGRRIDITKRRWCLSLGRHWAAKVVCR